MKRYLKTPKEVIDVLQDGKVVTNNEGCHYKMYKGVIFCFWKNKKQWDITFTLGYSDDLYVEEQEPLKLKVGEFYKTRDGRKAWVVAQQLGDYPYVVTVLRRPDSYAVKNDGRFYGAGTHVLDLIAHWDETK